jgi:uncharacterized protein (TIGR03435 family)
MKWGFTVLLILSVTATAQPRPTCEVASVRLNHEENPDPNFNSLRGGRLTITAESVRQLLQFAYSLKDFQILGAPAWADSEKYDVNAKADETHAHDDLKLLIRSMLQDRFGMKSHLETRELPVYFLRPGKNGTKLIRHDEGTGTTARSSCGHLLGNALRRQ